MPQFVTSGMSRGSAAIDSTKVYLFYIYLRHLHTPRFGAWWLNRKQMEITPNYVLYDSLQSWYARYDLELRPGDKGICSKLNTCVAHNFLTHSTSMALFVSLFSETLYNC